MNGIRSARARSAARVIFSPTTEPMLPPMNAKSRAQMTVRIPPIVPDRVDDGFGQVGFLLVVLQPLGVGLAVDEIEGVQGARCCGR